MDDSRSLAELVRVMETNPVLAMSLGSRELFHSNLLARFIRHYQPVAEALGFRDVDRVLREKDHTDLLITYGQGQVTVIENKVLALPDESQLGCLSDGPGSGAGSLVLLSLTSPGWADGAWVGPAGRLWSWLSYEQLARQLLPVVPAVTGADAYAGMTLDRWLDHFAQLQDLARLVGRPLAGEPLMLPSGLRQILLGARLDAAVQKMRCQRVAAGLAACGVHAHVSLTRGTGLVDWFRSGPGGLQFGWQLQGSQFRLAIIVPLGHPGHGRSEENRSAREEEAASHPGFFDFTPAAAVPAAGFRHYAPNFVYRYVAVPAITVGHAIELASAYTERIVQGAG